MVEPKKAPVPVNTELVARISITMRLQVGDSCWAHSLSTILDSCQERDKELGGKLTDDMTTKNLNTHEQKFNFFLKAQKESLGDEVYKITGKVRTEEPSAAMSWLFEGYYNKDTKKQIPSPLPEKGGGMIYRVGLFSRLSILIGYRPLLIAIYCDADQWETYGNLKKLDIEIAPKTKTKPIEWYSHAVVAFAYDKETDLMTCKNSYGEGWGDKGKFRFKLADAVKHWNLNAAPRCVDVVGPKEAGYDELLKVQYHGLTQSLDDYFPIYMNESINDLKNRIAKNKQIDFRHCALKFGGKFLTNGSLGDYILDKHHNGKILNDAIKVVAIDEYDPNYPVKLYNMSIPHHLGYNKFIMNDTMKLQGCDPVKHKIEMSRISLYIKLFCGNKEMVQFGPLIGVNDTMKFNDIIVKFYKLGINVNIKAGVFYRLPRQQNDWARLDPSQSFTQQIKDITNIPALVIGLSVKQ